MFEKIQNDEYHARSELSATMIKDFASLSRRKFHMKHVEKSLPRKSTDALEFGRLFHSVMESGIDGALSEYVALPDLDMRSSKNRALRDEVIATAEAQGKQAVKAEFIDKARLMAESISELSKTAAFFDASACTIKEQALFWERDGIDKRALYDLATDGTTHIICDYKTCSDVRPMEFGRDFAKFGYGLQVAHYCEGYHANFGEMPRFLFIAIEKEPPFECAILELDPGDFLLYLEYYKTLCDDYAAFAKSGYRIPETGGTIALPEFEARKIESYLDKEITI